MSASSSGDKVIDDKQESPAGAPVSETRTKDPYQEQLDRNRSRERKRRQDVSAAIEKLIALLLEIDPENLVRRNKQIYFSKDSPIVHANRKKRRCNGGPLFLSRRNQQNQPLSRTEIINYTVHTVEKLAREREEISLQIQQYNNIISVRSSARNQVQESALATPRRNLVINNKTPLSTNKDEATTTLEEQMIQHHFATGGGVQQQQQKVV